MPHPLAPAMHANYLAALQRITALGPGGASASQGPWLFLDAGLDFDYFNIAALTKPSRSPVAALAAPQAWFAGRGQPFRLVLRDDTDAGVARQARRAGFEDDACEPAMLLHPLVPEPRPTPAGLTISRVLLAEHIPPYAAAEPAESGNLAIREAISSRALAIEGCMLFLGCVDGLPVARSMALVTDGMAGVYNVFVRGEYRRRGYGAALTSAALDAACAAGATSACLSATELGLPLYERMGFETVFRYLSLWRPPG